MIVRTALVSRSSRSTSSNDFLSARYEADIWLKREDLTPVRSYKLRGAFNAMRKQVTDADHVLTITGRHIEKQ